MKPLLKHIQVEFFVKTALAILCSLAFFPSIDYDVREIAAGGMGDFLLIISMLLVTVSFANFAFTYEHVKFDIAWRRMVAHATTFLFVALTVVSLEAIVVATQVVYPSVHGLVTAFSVGLVLSIVLYDYWDLLKTF